MTLTEREKEIILKHLNNDLRNAESYCYVKSENVIKRHIDKEITELEALIKKVEEE